LYEAWYDSNNTTDTQLNVQCSPWRKVLNTAIQHIKPEEDIKKHSKVQDCHSFSFYEYIPQEKKQKMKECEKQWYKAIFGFFKYELRNVLCMRHSWLSNKYSKQLRFKCLVKQHVSTFWAIIRLVRVIIDIKQKYKNYLLFWKLRSQSLPNHTNFYIVIIFKIIVT
jgi:hypothetical protein